MESGGFSRQGMSISTDWDGFAECWSTFDGASIKFDGVKAILLHKSLSKVFNLEDVVTVYIPDGLPDERSVSKIIINGSFIEVVEVEETS